MHTNPLGGVYMHIALDIKVLRQDGTLVLTDHDGKAITFSKEQTIQPKVRMIPLGELCDLPKHQLANSFGFTTRKSSSDIRNAVLHGAPADLMPKRTGPPTPPKRTKEVEALIIRRRFETDEDGSTTNLIVTDLIGRELTLAFPIEVVSSLMMTLPRMIDSIVKRRGADLRVVYPLGSHTFELAKDGSTRILTLRTLDGLEVAFTLSREQYADLVEPSGTPNQATRVFKIGH